MMINLIAQNLIPLDLIPLAVTSPDPASLPALPAPVWFILFFKILGFILHILLMNLWLSALPLALILHWKGTPAAQRWGSRLIHQMPVFITFGVNFGIVPLLFIQLLYPQAFYPATILMAWHWLAIIFLLIPAYYGIYIYTFAQNRTSDETISPLCRAAGWLASLFFLFIGFFFVNGLTLTAQPELWQELWLSKEIAGATTGLGSAIHELSIWPRFGMMFALGLGTAAVWTLCDRNLFQRTSADVRPENVEYIRWSSQFARGCAMAGALLFIPCALFFVHTLKTGTEPLTLPLLCHLWLAGPLLLLGVIWKLAPKTSAGSALLVLGTQLLSLTVFACVRQWIQSRQLNDFLPLDQFKVCSDLGPMALFLGLFLLGAGVLAWMIWVACTSNTLRPPEKSGPKE